ncbi:MAG: pyridoxal-phosphate dependent enzyme [Acidihalobacter sp.]
MTDALHIETPLFESPVLSELAGRSVWLKLEALQPPGSFKIRGVGHACREYARRGANACPFRWWWSCRRRPPNAPRP